MEARIRDDFHQQQEAKEQRLVEEEHKRQLERDEALAWKLQKRRKCDLNSTQNELWKKDKL